MNEFQAGLKTPCCPALKTLQKEVSNSRKNLKNIKISLKMGAR